MSRFDYLEQAGAVKAGKKKKKSGKKAGKVQQEQPEAEQPQLEVVYVRRETVRAVWRELKEGGGESLSELVDDLLLNWLQEHQSGA
ncbi:hypothetical protein [Deinococcus radiophilus]|uniref:Uncharacterized protein n=1 Tax=Deinococcus radiophilus TaxID=32062 RepID=A0A3S0ILB1_9DEIO|nr:hypothetical protein [Deinococcus radiophilus]RTR26653.1 hypothetical protein EJ104_07730 [Deinococcus radiophilus]UFA51020.1 hypothetical protein LMT64_03730 [Deinococcus radiophilus]